MITACLTTLAFMVSSLHLAPEERVVRVSVEFKTADGVAIDDLPIRGTTRLGQWFGITDPNGRFEASLRVGVDERAVVVRTFQTYPLDPAVSDRARRHERLQERLDTLAFNAAYEVAIEGDTAASTIVVHPAGRAVARVRDSEGKEISEVNWSHHGPLRSLSQVGTRQLTMTGLTIPGPTQVAVEVAGEQILFLEVTCPNEEVVDLGLLRVAGMRDRVRVDVFRADAWIFDPRFEPNAPGITFLSLDPVGADAAAGTWGSVWGIGFGLMPHDREKSGPKKGRDYRGLVVPGRYALVPGVVQLTRLGSRVLEAWRAGEDLHAKWGLPIVEVTAEGPNEFEVSTEAIYKAVMGELPPTIDDRANALVEPGPTPPPTKAPVPPGKPE